MSKIDFQFSSPLTLLAEWRDNIGRLDDALVLGYTVDLAFLEHFFINQARGLGARITILSDAHNAVHSDVDVRGAGRIYQHGYALCSGAFHPKLALLIGEEDIWVAIGSGNPTTSGWGHNRELWLTIKAETESGPAALADLADWLRQLPHAVSIPHWIASTLTEVAGRLSSAATDPTIDGLTILGNLHTPILEQLPDTSVDHLGLSAPFFDPRAQAARALIGRLRPRSVTLGIQPLLSSYDGHTLAAALDQAPRAEVRHLSEAGGRLSHGKLIEWAADRQHTAMTGSANLSVSALMRSTVQGGNCELIACRTIDESLLPAGETISRQTLAAANTLSDEASTPPVPTIAVLGARLVAEGIDVEIVCNTPGKVEFEGSADGGPNSWTVLARFSGLNGHTRRTVPTPATPCRALRARFTTETGEVWVSPTAFITDTVKCQAPTGRKAASLIGDYGIDKVIDDPELAERFTKDMRRLLQESAKARATDEPSAPAPTKAAGVPADSDRWGTWMASFQQTVQPSLAGLLFPGAPSILQISAAGWSIDVDEGTDIAEDEDAEAFEQPVDGQAARREASSVAEELRPKWKRWDRTLVRQLRDRDVDLGLRLLVLRLHLDLLAGDVFRGEDDWTWELMDLIHVVALTKDTDVLRTSPEVAEAPAEVQRTLGALLAVCFSLLFDELRQVGGNEWDLRAQRLWRALAPLVANTDDSCLEHQLLSPGQSSGPVAGETATKSLRDRALAALSDPHAETSALLAAAGTPAEFVDGVWLLDDEAVAGRRTVAQILTTTGTPAAVIVTTSGGVYAALWDADTLIYTDTTVKSWRLFTMSGPFRNPRSRLAGTDGLAGGSNIGPLARPGPKVTEMCERVGVNPQMITLALTSWS